MLSYAPRCGTCGYDGNYAQKTHCRKCSKPIGKPPPTHRGPPGSAWSDSARRQRAQRAQQAAAAKAKDEKAKKQKFEADKKAKEAAEAKRKESKPDVVQERQPTEVEHWVAIVDQMVKAGAPKELLDPAIQRREDARRKRDEARDPKDQIKNLDGKISRKESAIEKSEKVIADKKAQMENLAQEVKDEEEKDAKAKAELEDLKAQRQAATAAQSASTGQPTQGGPTTSHGQLTCKAEAPEEFKQVCKQINDLMAQVRDHSHMLENAIQHPPPPPPPPLPPRDGGATTVDARLDDSDMEVQMSDDQLQEVVKDSVELSEMAKTEGGRAKIRKTLNAGV